MAHLDLARFLILAEQDAAVAAGRNPMQLLYAMAGVGKRLGNFVAHSLYGDAVARLTLWPAEWQLVPKHCRSLAAALPAALQRSQSEAACLVARLPADSRRRLAAAALCLSRASRRQLPAEVSGKILAACVGTSPCLSFG